MNYTCKYCNKEFENGRALGGHTTSCNLNPNSRITANKISEKLKGKINPSTKKEFVINCEKCNKEYIVECTENIFNKGKYKKNCSRNCANGRVWNESDKLKKSKAIKNSEVIKSKILQRLEEGKYICEYGCKQVAKFILNNKKKCCSEHYNQCINLINKKNILNKKNYENGLRNNKEIYKNLPQETKDKMNWNKGNINPDFSFDGKGNHKGFLIKERGHECEICNSKEWLGKKIILEMDHIDGNNRNNVKENLRLLCPNCHSQTPTWRGRNVTLKKKGKSNISDNDIIDKFKEEKSKRQILIELGLVPKGGNYKRINKLEFLYKENNDAVA